MNCYRSARLFSSNPYVWEMSCGWWLKEWHHGSGGRNELLVCGHHGTIAIYTGSWDMLDLLQFSPECSISLPQQLRATVACKNEARGPGLTHCFSTSQWASWWSFLGGRSQHKLERLSLNWFWNVSWRAEGDLESFELTLPQCQWHTWINSRKWMDNL